MAARSNWWARNWPWVVLAFLGGTVRLWWLNEVDTQPVTDFGWYFDRAAGLAQGMGYTTPLGHTAYWPPGFPLFLSVVFRLFGPSLLAAKAANALLTLLCGVMCSAVGFRLTGSRWLGFAAGLVTVLSPGMVAYSGVIASEPLYTCLVLGSVYLVLWAQGYQRWGYAGFLAGLATLVRPQAILVPLALAAAPGPQAQHRKPKRWAAVILCLLVALTTVTPWVVRTWRSHGVVAFVSLNGGDNLWIGHNASATGRYQTPPGKPDTPAGEVANERASRQAALQAIREDPARSFRLVPAKIAATFASPSDVPYWAFQTTPGKVVVPGMDRQRDLFLAVRSVSAVFNAGLLIGAGLGFLAGVLTPSGRRLIVVALPQIVLTAFVVALFFGNGRFALPTIPFQALLAVAGLASIAEWAGKLTPPDPDRYGYNELG